jgi:hypothetical protein
MDKVLFLGQFKFKCTCGKIHTMSFGCIAELANGHNTTQTCECGKVIEFFSDQNYYTISVDMYDTLVYFLENCKTTGSDEITIDRNFKKMVEKIIGIITKN